MNSLIRKARHIARSHGLAVLLRRAMLRLRSDLHSIARAQRLRLTSRFFLRLPRRIVRVEIPLCTNPIVSIVIPAYNRRRCTNACLLAIARVWNQQIPAEVIVVDDASTDDTPLLLRSCTGVRSVRRERNGGFAAACNSGAEVAHGRYLHFLNNDALVTGNWLQEMLDAFTGDDRVGAAVSQLREADGALSEAGGVIWSDGHGSNYGRGLSPDLPRFSFARDVDYGSAASLMLRADAFTRAGGFSQEFASGYYEDADLCFTLRAQGYRVRYQPRSVVIHLGGMTYGSNLRRTAVAQQEKSRAVFAEKWRAELAQHLPPDPSLIEPAVRRLCGDRCVLVIDEHVPFTDRSAGSQRIMRIMRMLRERNCHVIFGSRDSRLYAPYADHLQQSGIEVIPGCGAASLAELRRMRLKIDAVWLCRPEPALALRETCRTLFPNASMLYDTVDLHYLRLQREERVSGRKTGWERVRERELAIAREADRTIVTSANERDVLAREGIAFVTVVPVIELESHRTPAAWKERHGLIFVGNYSHRPNEDAAEWLCSEIMPLVWQRLPNLTVTLAGAEPTQRVRRLAGNRVTVTGFVDDLETLLSRHRLFVAPLRFGAGVKGKIVQALANGLPVVTTEIGDEGISVFPEAGIVSTSAQELAEAIVVLYETEALWTRLADGTRAIAARFTPSAVALALDEVLAPANVLIE